MSDEVAELFTMVKDLQIIESVLGDLPDPQVDNDLKLIRSKLDQIHTQAVSESTDNHNLLADVALIDALLVKLNRSLCQSTDKLPAPSAAFVPQNSTHNIPTLLSCQNAHLKRVLSHGPTVASVVLSESRGSCHIVGLAADLAGLTAQVHCRKLSNLDSIVEIGVTTAQRQDNFQLVTVPFIGDFRLSFSLSSDLTLQLLSSDLPDLPPPQVRPDLLWLLDSQTPRITFTLRPTDTECSFHCD